MAAKSKKRAKKAAKPKKKATKSKKKPQTNSATLKQKLLDMDQAIELLKTTRATFYRWLRAGKIKGMKVGRQWRFDPEEIDRFLKGEEPRIELRTDISPLLDILTKYVRQVGGKLASKPKTTGIQQVVDLMISAGLAVDASDIHVEPNMSTDGKTVVGILRLRIGGVLHVIAEFDIRLLPAIVEQWKIMAGCLPGEKIVPQDGRILLDDGSDPVDIRISFVPALLGETLTARILTTSSRLSLEDYDYTTADMEKLLRALKRPWGSIIVNGPTGCGKTTLLYACLNQLANSKIKVVTVEEPVEYVYPWMMQVTVRQNKGVTFPRVLRVLLRTDPDVIMVGEIRDLETAALINSAALTGHLVMTTLHTDEAVRALKRMVEIGCQPFVVGDATRLVIAQRLIRILCPHCSKETGGSPELLAKAERLASTGGLDWHALSKDFRKPAGCSKCKQLGYRGRTVLVEMLEVTPEIGKALRQDASLDELRSLAVQQGMTTLSADGIRKAAAGKISLEEVLHMSPHQ
ncbi:ATPase, T2SS/T4P/T4SS family [Planctomycetota bacterium]